MKCEHYECRCAAAHKLAAESDAFWAVGKLEIGRHLLRTALEAHEGEVECTYPALNFGFPKDPPC